LWEHSFNILFCLVVIVIVIPGDHHNTPTPVCSDY
jgi:hypothetical protein